MDKIIVTSILIIAAITTAAIVVFSVTSNTRKDSQITANIQSSQGDQIRTKIIIASVSANAQGTSIRVWARNIGSSDIEPINGIDVFLERMDNKWGSYIPFSINSGLSWSLESSSDSGTSSEIWEVDETVQFIITFPDDPSIPLADRPGIYQITLVTPNGVVETKAFEHNPIPFTFPTPGASLGRCPNNGAEIARASQQDMEFLRGRPNEEVRFFPANIFGDETTKIVSNRDSTYPTQLYDDGTNGDDIAGDGLFSSACLTMSDLSVNGVALQYDRFAGRATSYRHRNGHLNIINPVVRGTISHTDFGSGLSGTEHSLFVELNEQDYAAMRANQISPSPRSCEPCVVVLEEFGDVFDHLLIVPNEPVGGANYHRVSDNVEGILTYGDLLCSTGMWSGTWTDPQDFIYGGVAFGCPGKFVNGGDYPRLKGNSWIPGRDLGGLNHEVGHWMGIGPNKADFPGTAGIPLRPAFSANAVVSWNSEDRAHIDSNSTVESPLSGPFWDPQRGWPYSVKLQVGNDLKEVQIRWNGNNTFTMVPRSSDQEIFDDILLYMMGFLPPEQAQKRYYFLVDAEINLNDCVSNDLGLICTDPIIDESEYGTAVEYGVNELISLFGPRVPAYQDAPKDLNAAAIVLTHGLATEAERAWYDLLFGWWSTENDYDQTLGASWPFATRGLSTITTGIPTVQAP